MTDFFIFINDLIWGSLLTYLLLGGTIWFTFYCNCIQFRHFTKAFRLLRSSMTCKKTSDSLSAYQALCTSLAARIGTGNLAGVAVALIMGGAGAIFWMWVVSILGMATSFAECTLAQLYKTRAKDGTYRGGPAWYIERGLGMRWVSNTFAVFLIITFGFIFNAAQASSITIALNGAFIIPEYWTSIVLVLLTATVICTGLRGIARVSQYMVPFMAVIWIGMGLYITLTHIDRLPDVIAFIFKSAFGWQEAASGSVAYTISQAMSSGLQRGTFINEAGIGSTPHAAAAAETWPPHPISQGLIQMLGVVMDTILICSVTAMIILISGILDAPTNDLNGISLVQQALSSIIGSTGNMFIAFVMFLFAFTSIITNYAYAENNLLFLKKNAKSDLALLRCLVLMMVVAGTLFPLPLLWQLADVAIACMALINLTAILWLSPVVKALTSDYLRQHQLGLTPVFDPERFPELKAHLTPGIWGKQVNKSRLNQS